METANRRPNVQVKVDRYTRVCLTAIAALLTLVVIGLWADLPIGQPTAYGAEQPKPPLPDAAAQRDATVAELKRANQVLGQIEKVLSSGQIKVQVVQAENNSEGASNALPPKTK